MERVYLGLGSNLGDRQGNLDAAVAGLAAITGVKLIAAAEAIETEPVGGPAGQGAFLNSACAVETVMRPDEMLAAIHRLERSLGRRREREPRWGPRTIDIDILLWEGLALETPDLVLPHPRLAERFFALRPLAEIAPDEVHPGFGLTVRELLERIEQTQ